MNNVTEHTYQYQSIFIFSAWVEWLILFIGWILNEKIKNILQAPLEWKINAITSYFISSSIVEFPAKKPSDLSIFSLLCMNDIHSPYNFCVSSSMSRQQFVRFHLATLDLSARCLCIRKQISWELQLMIASMRSQLPVSLSNTSDSLHIRRLINSSNPL